MNFTLQLKGSLVIINMIFGILLLALVIFWFFSARPAQIAKGEELGQYKYFLLSALPNEVDNIKADYIGKQDPEEHRPSEHHAESQSVLQKNTEEENVNYLLQQTNQILNEKGAAGQEVAAEVSKQTPSPLIKPRYKVAIIVTNLGLNKRSTELALTLPKEFALGFLPYTKSLTPLLNKANDNGHEVYLYLPLQTSKSFDDPGKYTLLSDIAPEENAVRLNVILNSQGKYKGVYSNYKEVFTDNLQATEGVIDHLEDKSLLLVLGKTAKKPLSENLKARQNISPVNIIIDEEPSREHVALQLAKLERIAQTKGYALGYSQGFTMTMDMLKEWMPNLEQQGISLVPISELLKD